MRRHHVVAITPLATIATIHEIVSKPFVHLTDDGLAHARVDPLTLASAIAMTQRGECVKDDGRGDRIVGPGATGLARRTAGVTLGIEHADEAAGHRTPSDPARRFESGFAEERDRNHDDVGLDLFHLVVGEAKFFGGGPGKTFEDEVAAADDLVGEIAALGMLEVEANRLLAVVQGVIEAA